MDVLHVLYDMSVWVSIANVLIKTWCFFDDLSRDTQHTSILK